MDIISRILIRFSSDLVGEDQYGNKYYEKKKRIKDLLYLMGK